MLDKHTDVNLFSVLSITTKYASSNISSSSMLSVVLSELLMLSCRLLAMLKLFSSLLDSRGEETGDTGAETDCAPSVDRSPIKD